MKKILLTLMICSLFANSVENNEVINITKKSKVLIYTNLFWAPCKEAKALLQSRGIEYTTKMITFSRKNTEELIKKTGGKASMPQIFIDDIHFGGLLELKSYFQQGEFYEYGIFDNFIRCYVWTK